MSMAYINPISIYIDDVLVSSIEAINDDIYHWLLNKVME